jgi:CBS domain containing-hemolysin-like protein
MYPAIWLLNASAFMILRLFGLEQADEHAQAFSRDELKLILHGRRGISDGGEEITMMSHALELPELVVGDLLRTREQLASLHQGMTQEDILAEFQRSQFSRYPWFDEDDEHVLGVLHAKDLLQAIAGGKRIGDVRPAIVTPLDTPIFEVLRQFKGGHSSIALGREDSGRIAGYLTLSDIVQVVIGDVQDETRRQGSSAVQRAADGSFTISGGIPIYRLERLLDREIAAPEDINSVGGLITSRLERLPQEGDTLRFPEGFTLVVRTVEGPRATAISVLPHGDQ